jgi:alpha-ribazole phosphatase
VTSSVASRRDRLFRVRHAPVAVSGICYGRADVDVALDAPAASAQVLATLDHPSMISRIVSSPSRRTRTLAEALGAGLGCPVALDGRLAELAFGEWELRSWDALQAEDGARLQAWMADWRRLAPPGGERVDELVARVASFRASLGDEPILAVTHAGPIRALRALERGVDFAVVMDEPVAYLTVEGALLTARDGAARDI